MDDLTEDCGLPRGFVYHGMPAIEIDPAATITTETRRQADRLFDAHVAASGLCKPRKAEVKRRYFQAPLHAAKLACHRLGCVRCARNLARVPRRARSWAEGDGRSDVSEVRQLGRASRHKASGNHPGFLGVSVLRALRTSACARKSSGPRQERPAHLPQRRGEL